MSWWGFFIAFFIWFAIVPLLSEIKDDFGLTQQEIWTSYVVGVSGTIAMRLILGPVCDKYGARIPMAFVLCFASIPTACTGLVNSATELNILRFFIGSAGGTFVMCQYWTSCMFCNEVVGTANALVGGWGNLGGGVTQLIVGAGLFPLFRMFFDGDASKAWRYVSILPAFVAFCTGIMIYFVSDDAPKGNYTELKKHGQMANVSAAASVRQGTFNFNTWILFLQYAACFGAELTMNNATALYFKDTFDQSTESAAAIASIFGFMNLFARGLGGFMSDKGMGYMGMRGRLLAHTFFLVMGGILVLLFAHANSLIFAVAFMVLFSLFIQAAEGTTFGIVPYVDPSATGSISGIVGAGGNVGAVCFGIGLQYLEYQSAFMIMGFTIIGSSLLSLLIFVKGHSSLIWGQDKIEEEASANARVSKLATPVFDLENTDELEEE
jgi:NNP family nitrate/nitrite transporter-like MFS transporter